MLETILFTRREALQLNGNSLDLGFLVETMLFYQDVHLLANRETIRQLISAFGVNELIEFLRSGYLHLFFCKNIVGIETSNGGLPSEYYRPVFVSALKDQDFSRVAKEIIGATITKPGKARRLANQLADCVEVVELPSSVAHSLEMDFDDSEYLSKALKAALTYFVPDYEYPVPLVFRVEWNSANHSLKVETNVDFPIVNGLYHKTVPLTEDSIDIPRILAYVFDVDADLYLASSYSSEIATSAINSEILSLRMERYLQQRLKNSNEIAKFQDFTFVNSKAIRESINGGEHDFRDIKALLDNAKRFRHWLHNQDFNVDLTREYYREVTANSWIDALPSKVTRWAIFTGLGVMLDAAGANGIGTVAGLGLSVADAFILDRLIKGWKPSQFVQGPLREFIDKAS